MSLYMLEKCPTCGAPVEHYYNHKCSYCRNYLHITDFNIEESNGNIDVKDISVRIERIPFEYKWRLFIVGTTIPKFDLYVAQEIDKLMYTSGEIGKRIGYMISFEYEEIMDREFVIKKIDASLPPLFWEHKVDIFDKALDCIMKERKFYGINR